MIFGCQGANRQASHQVAAPARATSLRTTLDTCATEAVFAAFGIGKELPLYELVVVNFTPQTAVEFSFTCGMNMHRGKLIVR